MTNTTPSHTPDAAELAAREIAERFDRPLEAWDVAPVAAIIRRHFAQPAAQPQDHLSCPACIKLLAAYQRKDLRMARAGNFGIVPLQDRCKQHRRPAK